MVDILFFGWILCIGIAYTIEPQGQRKDLLEKNMYRHVYALVFIIAGFMAAKRLIPDTNTIEINIGTTVVLSLFVTGAVIALYSVFITAYKYHKLSSNEDE